LFTAFVKHCNEVQSRSETKVGNKAEDEGKKKKRRRQRLLACVTQEHHQLDHLLQYEAKTEVFK
jgi:hypothetical protein